MRIFIQLLSLILLSGLALLLSLILFLGVSFPWLLQKGTRVTVDLGLDQLHYSEEEKAVIASALEPALKRFDQGELTGEDVQQLRQAFMHEPGGLALQSYGAARHILVRSDLTNQEKDKGLMQLDRFIVALQQGPMKRNYINDLRNIALDRKNMRIKEELSDVDVRNCIQLLRMAADSAGVPHHVDTPDLGKLLSDDLKRLLEPKMHQEQKVDIQRKDKNEAIIDEEQETLDEFF